MSIPTEPIGSIPRPIELIEGLQAFNAGRISMSKLDALYDRAIRDTIQRLEETGSPVITDGEQTKPSFATYPIHGFQHLAPDGVSIAFEDGHVRQLPRLTGGPFRYQTYADSYLLKAKQYAHVPVKQAVISASALSLLYPQKGIADYSKEAFLEDLVREAEDDIRRCLDHDAYNVQIDFTEGRLAVKLDPTKQLLRSFLDLNNQILERFSKEERRRIGIHTCPGGDQDSTHSAEVDYSELLPLLFELKVGNIYMQFTGKKDQRRVLGIIKEHIHDDQKIFLGVIDVINPKVETPAEVRDMVILAAEYIPVDQLGTTDDCGFSPFGDDISTSRETAFAKVHARVVGTSLASEALGMS